MKIKQAILIEGNTLKEYVNAYNAAMEDIAGSEILSEERISSTELIVYYYKHSKAEKEESEAPKCTGNCGSCAYFNPVLDRFGEPDRRYKFGTCSAAGEAHVNKKMGACGMYKEA